MKKAFRTPTVKATVNYDPALLKSNHIYLAATDNEKIYVDDLFQQMPLYVMNMPMIVYTRRRI